MKTPICTAFAISSVLFWVGCGVPHVRPKPEYTLTAANTHNKFSRTIPPVLRVPSGAVVEVFTKEATDNQLNADSTVDDLMH